MKSFTNKYKKPNCQSRYKRKQKYKPWPGSYAYMDSTVGNTWSSEVWWQCTSPIGISNGLLYVVRILKP